jgi:hypothetical protein
VVCISTFLWLFELCCYQLNDNLIPCIAENLAQLVAKKATLNKVRVVIGVQVIQHQLRIVMSYKMLVIR